MRIGLFFGSFNPVHIGHLAVANYMLEYTDLEQIWFVLSPQSPFKTNTEPAPEIHRLNMLQESLQNFEAYQVCDAELKMPKPSYTFDTLKALKKQYPAHSFDILMGADNLKHFDKWKQADEIVKNHKIRVYARTGEHKPESTQDMNIIFYDAPLMEISSSFIRQAVKENKEMCFFMPSPAYRYMRKNHLYE